MGKGHCGECGGHTAGNCCSCSWYALNEKHQKLRQGLEKLINSIDGNCRVAGDELIGKLQMLLDGEDA